MSNYAKMSASFITRYFNKVTYRRQADKFHRLMKSGRFHKIINTFLI
jgi:REP element-mobilizing transposase RayT